MTTWRTSDGKKASQLQALENGEFLTIVETGPSGDEGGSSAKTTATLYHWGPNKTAPSGVPLPPLAAYAANKPAPSTMPSSTAAAKMPKLTEVPVASSGVAPMEMPDAPAAAKSARPTDTVKPAPKVVDAFKAYDTGKTVEAPRAVESGKATELPKIPEPVKLADAPRETSKPAEAAKLTAMPPPPSDFPKQAAPAVPAPTNVGKPATDTTAPATNALSSMPLSLSTPPSGPSISPAGGMPPTPAQLASLPSIAPSNSMLGSQFVGSTKSDPLSSPESFAPLSDQKALAMTPAKVTGGGSAQATDYPRVPLGAASVAAAANAGDSNFLPVQASSAFQGNPQLAAGARTAGTADQTAFANAFSTPPIMQPPTGMAFQQAGPMMPVMGGGYPMPPANPAMMASGYPMPPAYPPMTGYGYGPQPMMVPPGMPMQGRMPIAMTPAVAMQNALPQPQMPMATPAPGAMAYANPAMDRPGMPMCTSMSVTQCIGVLQSSLYPSQRETAVIQLCSCDWRTNPHVVTMLLTTAKEDPAAIVRVAAINALVRMGVATDSVLGTFNQLKNDVDGRVRLEAEEALKVIGTR